MSILSAPHFHDEAAAFARVEKVLWPQGPVCHHCGCMGRISAIPPNPEKRVRFGLKRCGDCKQQFTVRMGTIFEESKLPMTKWLQAIYLMVSSKKGVSAHQLHRTLETTYKTAWFLAHRIREAMRDGELAPFGGGGGIVEIDETFQGQDPDAAPSKMVIRNKNAILTLVERGGRADGSDTRDGDHARTRLGCVQNAPGAFDVDLVQLTATSPVVRHKAGEVEHAIATLCCTRERKVIAQVARRDLDPKVDKLPHIRCRACQRTHLLAAFNQFTHEMAAEEACRAGNECGHRRRIRSSGPGAATAAGSGRESHRGSHPSP